MNRLHSTRPKPTNERTRLLIFSLLLSLGLHILVVVLLPLLQQEEKLQPLQQQPTIVRLVDLPVETKKTPAEKPREFEIDPLPAKPQPEVPVESFRKADRDQKVEQELAPQGEDVRDQTTKPPITVRPPKQIQKPQDKAAQKPVKQTEQNKLQPKKEKSLIKAIEETPAVIKQAPQPNELQLLTPEQLRPDTSTLEQIARGSQADRNRVKERKDVEIGDTVWLNLQHNLLVSFFRRFHDKIELVWNYPTKAIVNGVEGTLELLIIVNKNGELIDVDLKQTSGSDILDFEAIQAIYRAAPFGPLTKHYPHEKLKIRAYFSYRISGQYIYGRQN